MGDGPVCVFQKTSLAFLNLTYLLLVCVTGVSSGPTHSTHISQVKQGLSAAGMDSTVSLFSPPPELCFSAVSCSEPEHWLTEHSSRMSCNAVCGVNSGDYRKSTFVV